MIRLKSAILAVLILALACSPLLAQKPANEARWTALNNDLKRAYDNEDWPWALSLIDRLIKLGDETQNQQYRGGILYTKACVHALATQTEPLVHYRSSPIEFCEVASMSMELLAADRVTVAVLAFPNICWHRSPRLSGAAPIFWPSPRRRSRGSSSPRVAG